ncbi:hypothetical protein DAPPUDRAFT_300225 [Daphnia pulex]|uniref:Uncharacterized protein n=1 Tax=Daphnia pulex TaxID=6669 RepID=E9G5G1_DAPPU|nr:hypothetical protein DAPPUDRAFT_300225 [Daphnia pulex]|eukprot:EFX85198.1 hypothetical protein DAPPUDRAFT_300225 [Daphnia pulex]
MSINLIVCSIPLVVVAIKKRPLRFLMPWLGIGATTFLIGIITICILLNVVIYIAPTTIIAIWFWLIVYSYYNKLKKNHVGPISVERTIL